jgi:lipoic acid synthetase
MTKPFPEWIKRNWASGTNFGATRAAMGSRNLHTVCQSAHCPNIGECWQHRTATLMVLGNTCTRNCSFCSVNSGKQGESDPDEPLKVAEAVAEMGLRHAVITMVERDDLPDGGATHMATTVKAIRAANPQTTIEVLVSDLNGEQQAIEVVLAAAPEVFGHNIETVERLYPALRDRRFRYRTALDVLRLAADYRNPTIVKSAMMVGHGETEDDVRQTFEDLLGAGCDAVCIGQYLRPTQRQREVVEFIHPDQFKAYEQMAYAMGFHFVQSGPFVRSSYRSEAVMSTPFARERLAGRHVGTASQPAK